MCANTHKLTQYVYGICTYTHGFASREVCTYAYRALCIYKHTYIRTDIHTDIHTYIHTAHTHIHGELYIHTHVHTYIHTCRHACMHTHRHTYTTIYIYTCVHTLLICMHDIRPNMITYVHVCMHACVCVRLCVCVCLCVCVLLLVAPEHAKIEEQATQHTRVDTSLLRLHQSMPSVKAHDFSIIPYAMLSQRDFNRPNIT